MRYLVLVRHGQSEWNAERRVQGQGGTGLSELGRKQAERTADWLAATFPDARLFASDLQRCVETAAPLAERLGREPELRQGLRERDFGAWTGHLLGEVEARWPELWERWRDGDDVVDEVGGESSTQLADRVEATFDAIVEGLGEDGVAVCVTHGGPVWHGTHRLLGLPHGTLGAVGNTAITEIVDDAVWGRYLDSWNQVAHLPVDLRSWLRPTAGSGRRVGEEGAGAAVDDEIEEAVAEPAPPVGR